MYKLIAIFSSLIRNFVLPNPFEKLPTPLCISINGMEVAIPAAALNGIIEPFLHLIAFAVAGLYYQKGIDNPAKGSGLYLLFYCVHTGVLFVMSCFQFSRLIIAVAIITYTALHVGVNVLKNKLLYVR